MAQLSVAGYNVGENVSFESDNWEIVPFQGQGMNGIGDYSWDEQISWRVAFVHNNLGGLLANRDMPSGFRTAAENLRSQMSSILQILHTAVFRDLPEQVQQQIIDPMLNAARISTQNFYDRLGETANFIEALETTQSGVPSSSGVIRNDRHQTTRQRRQAQIDALPQPDPRQVENPPPPPSANDITWLDHLQHVVQYCRRNWKWIALGTAVGVVTGGIGGAVLSGTMLAVGTGVVAGGVGAGVGTTGVVAGVQCSRCIRGQCQDHPHQD